MRHASVLLLTAMIAAAQTKPSAPAKAAPAAAKPAAAKSGVAQLKFPQLRSVKIPEVATFTLANGMKLYLLEDHELPMVRGFALVRTGSLLDPADKTGLGSLAGTVMRSGGTKALTGDQLDEKLENIAASVESGVGETNASVSFNCLKENLGDVLPLFHDIIVEPEFRQNKIDLAKQQTRSAIMRRNDDPGSLGGSEFSRTVYGKDTPFGRRVELATVDKITRQDLIDFHKRYYFPKNIMLAVTGDFSTADMKARIEKLFESWTVEQPEVPAFPEVNAPADNKVHLATKPDVTQTFFFVGQLGGTLRDKDFAALEVMSDILGGGFSSRLFRKVRTELGLAYNVSSSWGAGFLRPGLFEISGSTQSKATVDTLQAVFSEVKRMREGEVTEQELRTAKDTVLNSFVFNFDKPSKTLNRLVTYAYYGYPPDFINRYQAAIDSVTRADVARVAKERLKPEQFTIVAVGNPADFGKALSELGRPVENVDLTIPEPGAGAAPVKADAASASKAKDILARAQKAMGGAEKFAAVKDYSQSVDLTLSAQGQQMKSQNLRQVILPSLLRQEQELPFGKVIAFFDGKSGWLQTPQGNIPMPEPVIRQVRTELFRGLIPLMAGIGERQAVATSDNSVQISDSAGNSVTIEFDAATGLPTRQRYSGIGMSGPTKVTETYSDWRDVNGIRLPFQVSIEQDGNPAGSGVVKEWKINPGLKPEDLSKKP